MTKTQKEEYWRNCIKQCRTSGLSDYAWCNQNGISTSSFYYNIKRLRNKACVIPASVSNVVEKTEVVPGYNMTILPFTGILTSFKYL